MNGGLPFSCLAVVSAHDDGEGAGSENARAGRSKRVIYDFVLVGPRMRRRRAVDGSGCGQRRRTVVTVVTVSNSQVSPQCTIPLGKDKISVPWVHCLENIVSMSLELRFFVCTYDIVARTVVPLAPAPFRL